MSFAIAKSDNGKKGTIHIAFVPTLHQGVFLLSITGKENLLGFPAAVRLAFGLYTGLCSGRRGHVHCLGAWRWRDGHTERETERDVTHQLSSRHTCQRWQEMANYIHFHHDQNYGG